MSLEQILERIIADAKAEAAAIEAKGSEEARRALAAAQNEASEIHETLTESTRREAEERAARVLTLARLEARNSKLVAKQEAIDEAFTLALKQLCELPLDQYRDVLLGQILAATQTGDEEVVLSPSDRTRLGPELVARANDALQKDGRPAQLKLSAETRPLSGGLILRHGDVEVNCTFATAIRLVRDELVPVVADCLFGANSEGS